MKRIKTIVQCLATIALSLSCSLVSAGIEVSSKWNALINDPAFYYKDEKEALQKVQPEQNNILEKLSSLILAFFTSSAGKFIGWVIFFIVLAWALFKIFTGDFPLFGKKTRTIREAVIEDPEETLVNTNWEHHLDLAIQDANNRLAIRYSFMRLLQLLQLNGLIHFEENKTNADYYNELGRIELKQDFRQLSKQYEYAWYGHFGISDEAYRDYMNIFNNLKSILPQS